MKIAGQKNDGAWFRFNKAIRGLTESEVGSLNAAIYLATLETRENAFNAIVALGSECGVMFADINDGSTLTPATWIARMLAKGIPRQVWNGYLSFTTYNRTGTQGSYKYHANYQSEMLIFAKQLRKVAIKWMKARRAMRDLGDIGSQAEGNPGGQPDAHKGT